MKVFFDERQVVKDNNSFSPSAGKPALVVDSWKSMEMPIELMPVSPCSVDDICKAHDRNHVEDILNCVKNNGFHNKLESVANSLPWTTGSFCSAAEYAFKNKESVCSPTSGFHHAGPRKSEGFCTFNGLMIAAIKLLELGVKKVAILDIDMHYGNGTHDIMVEKSLFSEIVHHTFGAYSEFWEDRKSESENWINEILPKVLISMKDVDIVLYQSGADPHIDDPFGGALTSEQLLERDRMVFSFFKEANIPVVWNLAGGYQDPIQKVLDIHNNTRNAFFEVYGK